MKYRRSSNWEVLAWGVAFFWLTFSLGGCAQPDLSGTVPLEAPPPFSASGDVPPPIPWWTAFDNATLNQQIDQCLNNNYTLASAWERLRAARALTRREASDLLPDLDFLADAGATFQTDGPDAGRFEMGFGAGYQVDLWGQIEARVEAEGLEADATLADYYATALTLSAEVARTWFALTEAHAQLALLQEQVQTNLTGLELQEARFELGQIRSADVLRQRQLVESTHEAVVVVRSRIAVLENLLAVLQARPPQAVSYHTGATLPDLPPLPSTGLPSELLQRRPDVRRDFLLLMSADRRLASAVTAQYPRLNLAAVVTTAAESPENLFRDWIVSIAGQLVAPLFDGGERRAEVDRNSALVRQRFDQYADTVLNAYRDVEDALARERFRRARIERLNLQLKHARQASIQLREQYLIGEADYLDVLSAITGEQRLQRETLSARLDLIEARIDLYLALAGDFGAPPQHEDPEAPGPGAEPIEAPEPADPPDPLTDPEADGEPDPNLLPAPRGPDLGLVAPQPPPLPSPAHSPAHAAEPVSPSDLPGLRDPPSP